MTTRTLGSQANRSKDSVSASPIAWSKYIRFSLPSVMTAIPLVTFVVRTSSFMDLLLLEISSRRLSFYRARRTPQNSWGLLGPDRGRASRYRAPAPYACSPRCAQNPQCNAWSHQGLSAHLGGPPSCAPQSQLLAQAIASSRSPQSTPYACQDWIPPGGDGHRYMRRRPQQSAQWKGHADKLYCPCRYGRVEQLLDPHLRGQ